ncbi:hypothetical protein [Catellatospora chokoriensis]|uniref:Nucleotidyltransferase-like protein n=1 Tax=Catellatospora chokoriensis TaxID=310353 RepID=A0A8J3K8F8_9ACTN|nr:hypothetical protein [Catellatospora chokoriensis]GIF90414.1 hypothetical protein Cch02nite_38580 [Catellatospora chokoriensis]
MIEPGLESQLRALADGRRQALDRVTTAARENDAAALLLIGSLGRGGGDAFSDLDLIVVPGPSSPAIDPIALFGDVILASLDVPRNAPAGGAYHGLCLAVADAVLWLDLYTWPAETAALPADATAVFDHINLPHSDLAFIPLITKHAVPGAPAHPDNDATRLLRIAVAAKYLARGDLARIIDKLPAAQGCDLDAVPMLLHELLDGVDDPDLAHAVSATAALIDLAEATAA